jgi:acyl carrier protein
MLKTGDCGIMNEHTATAHTIEAQCLEIYRKILGVQDLQAVDDFASAGGTSVKAVLIATALEGAFGVEITMATFFANKNAAEMAGWLQRTLTA